MLKTFRWLVITGLTGTLAMASNYSWVGSTGSFQTGSNWSPTGVPGAADNAIFTNAATYGVSFGNPVTNTSATVGTDVTFSLNGYSWILSNALSFSGSGIARFGGGALEVGSSVTVGANQKLVLGNDSSWFKGSQLGTASGGTIEVNGGNHVLAWAMPLNAAPSGGASFRMTGGTVSLTNGAEGTRITLFDGARMSLEGGTLSIKYIPDTYGTRTNPTVIDIYTNATFNSHSFGVNISRNGGGLGIMNIRGGAFVSSNGTLQVANSKAVSITTGLVNLVDGLINTRNCNLGYMSNSVAILRQTDGQLQVPQDFYLGKDVNALGIFNQEGGAAWVNQLFVGGASSGTGEVNLVGGTLAVVNTSAALGKSAGSCGRFLQTGGSLIFSNSLSVGVGSGSFGVYTNTGGNLWLNGSLYLGNGAGSLGKAWFGGFSNTINGGISVGVTSFGTGELAIVGGSLLVPNGSLMVGSAASSKGAATISGGNNVFKGFTVGDSGTGSLIITDGMMILTNSGGVMVGNNAGSSGTLEISGGTNIFCGASTTIGQKGIGVARFSGGYTYTTNRFIVGGGSNGIGRLELCGGILSTPIIDGRDTTLTNGNPGGYSEVLFDGGTLQHSVDAEWWMPGGFVSMFGKATLTDRGAVIDSNGGVLTISQALSNEVGHAGSFTKKGAGKVTLYSGYNAFTGRVAVEAGELIVPASGAIYLTGGVAIDAGAVLNLTSAGSIRDLTTASGTVSRIDGTLSLKSGTVLTNGLGAVLGGSGVVTGGVVFASGSLYGRDKADAAGALTVTGDAIFQTGVDVRLIGYTLQDLKEGVPLMAADATGTLAVSGVLPVTLNGASHPYWRAKVSPDGKTLVARYLPNGTMISVK